MLVYLHTRHGADAMKTFLKVLSWLQLVTAVLSGDAAAIAVAVATDEK